MRSEILLTFALLAGGCCRPGAAGDVSVVLRPQEASQWCWAASGQMVMETLHHGTNQCTQVNRRLGRTDCPCNQCAAGGAANVACDQNGWPEFSAYGFTSRHTRDSALSWDAITKQVSDEPSCDNKPFAFTWHWAGGGGHMMVANGYSVVDGERYVSMVDPQGPLGPCHGDESLITYDHFVAIPGDHTHWDDYYDVTYRGL